MLDLQRATVLAGLALLAFACSEAFTGTETPTGGAGGTGATSGSAVGGDSATDGGVDTGGASVGGSAGGRSGSGAVAGGSAGKPSTGGRGGVGSLGGNGGVGGSVVQLPEVPLEGLELWFDANVGVTQMNGVVSTWKDRSPHQRDALQTALNFRPKVGMSVLNGKPGIVFDGENDYLKSSSSLPGDFTQGVSIFVVGQQDAAPLNCNGFFEASNGPEKDDVHVGTWQDALLFEVEEGTLHATDYQLVLGKPQLVSVVQQTIGAGQLRRNSNALEEGSIALPPTAVREQVLIGSSAYVGCTPLQGSISELIVYSRAVSDTELIDIETYLQSKWGCCSE